MYGAVRKSCQNLMFLKIAHRRLRKASKRRFPSLRADVSYFLREKGNLCTQATNFRGRLSALTFPQDRLSSGDYQLFVNTETSSVDNQITAFVIEC